MIFGGSPVDWKPPSVYDGMHPARIWRFVVSGTCQNIFILFFPEYILNILYSSYFRMMICEIPETGAGFSDPWNFLRNLSRGLDTNTVGSLGSLEAVCQISEEGKVLVSQGEFAPRHLDAAMAAMECHGFPWNPGD